jgi:hypothetical protein
MVIIEIPVVNFERLRNFIYVEISFEVIKLAVMVVMVDVSDGFEVILIKPSFL